MTKARGSRLRMNGLDMPIFPLKTPPQGGCCFGGVLFLLGDIRGAGWSFSDAIGGGRGGWRGRRGGTQACARGSCCAHGEVNIGQMGRQQ